MNMDELAHSQGKDPGEGVRRRNQGKESGKMRGKGARGMVYSGRSLGKDKGEGDGEGERGRRKRKEKGEGAR